MTLGWSQSPSYSYSNSLHDALRIAQDARGAGGGRRRQQQRG